MTRSTTRISNSSRHLFRESFKLYRHLRRKHDFAIISEISLGKQREKRESDVNFSQNDLSQIPFIPTYRAREWKLRNRSWRCLFSGTFWNAFTAEICNLTSFLCLTVSFGSLCKPNCRMPAYPSLLLSNTVTNADSELRFFLPGT